MTPDPGDLPTPPTPPFSFTISAYTEKSPNGKLPSGHLNYTLFFRTVQWQHDSGSSVPVGPIWLSLGAGSNSRYSAQCVAPQLARACEQVFHQSIFASKGTITTAHRLRPRCLCSYPSLAISKNFMGAFPISASFSGLPRSTSGWINLGRCLFCFVDLLPVHLSKSTGESVPETRT